MTGPLPDGVLRSVDSVQLPVPDLDAALAFYRDALGHALLWRSGTAAAVRLPDTTTELVLQVERGEPEVDLLVASVDRAVADVLAAGGTLLVDPFDIPVGRVARVADPFGNALTLVDLGAGRYVTDADGAVVGVASAAAPATDARFLGAVPNLPVSDERRAAAFLEQALGMVELQHDGDGLGIFLRDGVELHVWVADGSAPGAERHLAGFASCRIEVVGVRALYEHCRGLGVVHPNAPLRDQWWGTREFGVLDPDGNLISLYERI
jgi:catechol 2,3-dioxygenase-like lactoylglutathione lyase family enzyme